LLIAEAYTEQSDYLRLVRLTSALEALALLEGQDKAHQLATRCANVGGWSSVTAAVEIYDRMRAAYHWRSAVIHGDSPPILEVRKAFRETEEYLLRIVLGFTVLFAAIATEFKAQSVRQLRRELKERMDMFFWAPDLVTKSLR
jgi:hypothetical protein